MSPAIGAIAQRETGKDTILRARARADLIPDLLVEAQRISNNVFAGWHGRKKRGIGENFWQFRPYSVGENMAAIDWRKSARDDHIYVKDREWQAAHTVWLWVDESPSMLFKSDLGSVSKQSRALVLAFAMAELLARSGERVGWLGVTPPIASRTASEKLAEALILSEPQDRFPIADAIKDNSDIIIFSDFLDTMDNTEDRLRSFARRGANCHLVQIIDPVEETFPYAGRVEFIDPETNERLTAGNAQGLADDYTALFAARNASLRTLATKLGWSYLAHHTDRLASEALVTLHEYLGSSRQSHHHGRL